MAKKQKAKVDHGPLIEGLALNGFIVTAEVIGAWSADQIAMIRDCLTEWDIYTPGRSRTPVPEWLTEFDAPGDARILEARTVGAEWRKMNPEADEVAGNPWPESSQLYYGWSDGATFGIREVDADLPDEEYNIVAEPETAAAVVNAGAAVGFGYSITPTDAIIRDTVEASKKVNRLTCSKRDKAVLSIVRKLGTVTPACNEAQLKYQGAHQIATKLKKEWESLQLQMQGICTQLASVANGGDYQADLFDEPEVIPHSPPHAEIHHEGGGATEWTPAVDTGGELDLKCLTRKELAAIGSDAEGLSAGKIDILRSACEGDTIAKLEAMQRSNPSWNRDIKGFGDKWIDRLQDAHSAVRTHYPMPVESYEPSRDKPDDEPTAGAVAVVEPQDNPPEIGEAIELEQDDELVAVGAESDGFGEDMPE